MNLNEFISKYDGVGVNYDGAYGNQCVDLYRQYVKEVCQVPQSPSVAGAKDIWTTYLSAYFDRIANTPTGVPQAGDIIIWNSTIGTYGHVGIFISGNTTSFTSFDQNWPDSGGRGVAHKQAHNYTGVQGWLRLKQATPPVDQHIQQINDLEVTVTRLQESISTLTRERAEFYAEVLQKAQEIQTLKDNLTLCESKPPVEIIKEIEVITEVPVEKVIYQDKPLTFSQALNFVVEVIKSKFRKE